MKSVFITMICLGLTLAVWAQAGSDQGTPPPQPPSGGMHHDMGPMMQQHMQEMKAQVESMRAKVDQMKANLPKIKDAATKQQMQLDTELWDAMVSHLEGMQKMMSGQGMGGMHHGPHGPNPSEPPSAPQQ
jgi:hypothetical protein